MTGPPEPIQHAVGQEAFTSGVSGVVDVTIAAAGAGNCLVACVSAVGSSGTPSVTAVKTGTAAENWSSGVELNDASNTAATAIWCDPDTAGGGVTVAVAVAFGATATATDSCVVFVDVFEVPGVASSSPADQSSTGPEGGDSDAWTSDATGETSQASEIAFGAMTATALSGSLTVTGPASPWVNEAQLSGSVDFGGTAYDCYAMAGYLPLSAQGAVAYAGSTSVAGIWDAVVLTLKAAPAPAAPAVSSVVPLIAAARARPAR